MYIYIYIYVYIYIYIYIHIHTYTYIYRMESQQLPVLSYAKRTWRDAPQEGGLRHGTASPAAAPGSCRSAMRDYSENS